MAENALFSKIRAFLNLFLWLDSGHMFGLRKTLLPKRERVFTVLDIGTEYVKALVCQVHGKDIHILGRGRKRQTVANKKVATK